MNVIKLENIGKKFILSYQREKTTEVFSHSISEQKVIEEFWALKNINMQAQTGKVIGIIGRNGAGKSTLFNIMAGITAPTEGKVKINGKVSSLLTLGAGFQEELSGRENVYLNASILGMSNKEIERKYESIVEFSGIKDFLDAPLMTYSQGMKMRLGFSIATNVDFDIVLVDEVISVGDGAFQRKCFDRIIDFKRQGKTMIITVHSLDYIERICDEVFLLEGGRIIASGDPTYVVNRYQKLLNENRPLRMHAFED